MDDDKCKKTGDKCTFIHLFTGKKLGGKYVNGYQCKNCGRKIFV